MSILRVTHPFSVLSDPNGRVYSPGDLVRSDDPVVRGREHHFETVEAAAATRANTTLESASAAPGEKRTRTRAKAPAKSASAAPGEGKSEA